MAIPSNLKCLSILQNKCLCSIINIPNTLNYDYLKLKLNILRFSLYLHPKITTLFEKKLIAYHYNFIIIIIYSGLSIYLSYLSIHVILHVFV